MTGAEKRKKSYYWGIHAETCAAWFLRCKGYQIIATRYRNAAGEIDIVARKRTTLIAVEVKARATLAACVESITPLKQQRVARAMEGLAAQQKITGLAHIMNPNIRFDVIWVVPWRLPKHIKDAWRL